MAHQHNQATHANTRWEICDRRQIKNRHTTKTKHNPEKKQTTQNSAKQN